MGKLNILSNAEGHTTLEWPEVHTADEAKSEFNKIMARNGLAYKVTETGNEQIREFDPEASEIVIHDQLVGG